MPDENTTQTVAECERNADGAILMMLTVGDHRPWSVEEVIREYGESGDAIDALNRLHGHGLIHRTSDDFVWATRAAIRGDEISI